MKTPRELILERHRRAESVLRAIRGEDLAAAVNVSRPAQAPMAQRLFRIALEFWHESVLPWRRAWTGMAVGWFVLLAMSVSTNGLAVFSIKTAPPMSPKELAAWREQRQFIPQLSQAPDADLHAPKTSSGGHSEIRQKMVIL